METQTQSQELTQNLWDLLMSSDKSSFELGDTILETAEWIDDEEKYQMSKFSEFRYHTINSEYEFFSLDMYQLYDIEVFEYVLEKGIFKRLIQCTIGNGYNYFYIDNGERIEFEDIYYILKIMSSFKIEANFSFTIGSHLKKLKRRKSEILSMFEDSEWSIVINTPDHELRIENGEWDIIEY